MKQLGWSFHHEFSPARKTVRSTLQILSNRVHTLNVSIGHLKHLQWYIASTKCWERTVKFSLRNFLLIPLENLDPRGRGSQSIFGGANQPTRTFSILSSTLKMRMAQSPAPQCLCLTPVPHHYPVQCAVTCIVWQEWANERDELQSKVTTLENDIAMRDQQLQEYQQRIDQLSQKHEAAVDEGNTLRQQVESYNK